MTSENIGWEIICAKDILDELQNLQGLLEIAQDRLSDQPIKSDSDFIEKVSLLLYSYQTLSKETFERLEDKLDLVHGLVKLKLP